MANVVQVLGGNPPLVEEIRRLNQQRAAEQPRLMPTPTGTLKTAKAGFSLAFSFCRLPEVYE